MTPNNGPVVNVPTPYPGTPERLDNLLVHPIPARVHRNHSETHSGRNTKSKRFQDASNLRAAVDSNFNAIKRGLLEEGFSEADIEGAREQLHTFNKEQGWY